MKPNNQANISITPETHHEWAITSDTSVLQQFNWPVRIYKFQQKIAKTRLNTLSVCVISYPPTKAVHHNIHHHRLKVLHYVLSYP